MRAFLWWQLTLQEKLATVHKIIFWNRLILPVFIIILFIGLVKLALSLALLSQVIILGIAGDMLLNHSNEMSPMDRNGIRTLAIIALGVVVMDLLLLSIY